MKFVKDEKIIEFFFFSFNYLPLKKQSILLPNDSLTERVLDRHGTDLQTGWSWHRPST